MDMSLADYQCDWVSILDMASFMLRQALCLAARSSAICLSARARLVLCVQIEAAAQDHQAQGNSTGADTRVALLDGSRVGDYPQNNGVHGGQT